MLHYVALFSFVKHGLEIEWSKQEFKELYRALQIIGSMKCREREKFSLRERISDLLIKERSHLFLKCQVTTMQFILQFVAYSVFVDLC